MRTAGAIWLALGAAAAPAADPAPSGPAIGPVPAWVRPQVPAAPPKDDGTAVRVLLQDQQVRFEPGASSTFAEGVMALQTAQGLPAGNVAFAWDPATQKPTVHRLTIRRGDKVIDVLASQKFTVIRREQNLESATLDGVLTATLQPEGLQVGDVVDFALSIETRDPVMGLHVERVSGGWNGLPVARAHLRAEWPDGLPLRLRQTAGLPPLKEDHHGGSRSAELTVDDLAVLPPPNGAPPRFSRLRWVEMTDWRSWADLGTLMAPLYAKAGVLPASGPLRDEWAKLDAGATTPEAKAAAMLAFVEQRVRYVALQMGQGGYVPADAATTWDRRFGDCKGKTALLLALLHASGITAVPVAANAVSGDGTDESLPMVGLFNHVLVRATIGGRDYWLDGTRTGDTDLARLRVPDFGWGVPLVARGAALVRLQPPPLDRPDDDREIAIDASAGLSLPAAFRVTSRLRGDGGQGTGIALSAMPADQRDRGLRDYWRKQYPFVEPEQVALRYDPASGETTLTMNGSATLDWRQGWYETDGTGIGWQADFHRDPGPNRDAPFAATYPFFTRVKEAITLPPGTRPRFDAATAAVDRTIAGVRYHRTADLKDGVFTVETIQRGLEPEFPAADAPAAQAALRKLADENVFLGRPDDYKPTRKELEAAAKVTPKTAADYIQRASALRLLDRKPEAMADLDQALRLDPANENGIAQRASARSADGQQAAADQDWAAVKKINPHNMLLLFNEMNQAMNQRQFADVVRITTELRQQLPGMAALLGTRAQAEMALGQNEAALADADAALAGDPKLHDISLVKINILRRLGRSAEVQPVLDAMIADDPANEFPHVIAAKAYYAMGKPDAAMVEMNKALAMKPVAYVYLNRASMRRLDDKAGRRADLGEALRLDPANLEAAQGLTGQMVDEGDNKGALDRLGPALAAHPHDMDLLLAQGIVLSRLGREAEAARSFAAARAQATNGNGLNSLCWAKATRGVALPSALDDCNAAIARTPDPAFLDSRGLVNLRLGRLDAALADYDAALAKVPTLASSLMGRSLVHAQRGEAAAAAADRQAAVAAAPRIVDSYRDYGVLPKAEVALAAAPAVPAPPKAVAPSRP